MFYCSVQNFLTTVKPFVREIKAEYLISLFLTSPSMSYLPLPSLAVSGCNKKQNMTRATFCFITRLNTANKSDQLKNVIQHCLYFTTRHSDFFCFK